jgi:hypothetical protein
VNSFSETGTRFNNPCTCWCTKRNWRNRRNIRVLDTTTSVF